MPNIPANAFAPIGKNNPLPPFSWPQRSASQMPRAATGQAPAKIPVQTIPIKANPALSAINSAAPGQNLYPPEVLDLYTNAANNGPIGGNLGTAPNATTGKIGDMVRGFNQPFLSGDPGVVDWNAVAPDALPPGGYLGLGSVPPQVSQALQRPQYDLTEARNTASIMSRGGPRTTPFSGAVPGTDEADFNTRFSAQRSPMIAARR